MEKLLVASLLLIAAPGAQAGTVVLWGSNPEGANSVPTAALSDVTAIAANGPILALKTDGTVVAWRGAEGDVADSLSDVAAVAAGTYHSLALKIDGTVVAWGDNTYKQCNVPQDLNDVIAIAGGDKHSLALKNDRTVVAWGDHTWGQTNVPAGLTDVIAIGGGWYHSLALKSDGTVIAWGANPLGQTTIPTELDDAFVTAIAVGGNHNLALTSEGKVIAWGYDGPAITVPAAAQSGVVAIAASQYYHSLALKSDGTVVGWGQNFEGQVSIPPGLSRANVTAIAAGWRVSLALTESTPDLTSPTITITTPADNAEYVLGEVVNADYQCQDETGGSGIATCAGDVENGTPIDTGSLGYMTFTVIATDNVGNPASVTRYYTVIPSQEDDVTSPTITITTPADNAVYLLGQVVNADYSCEDEPEGSGVATCVGDVEIGAPIDTSSAGDKTFTVSATDNAGNPASMTHNYSVMTLQEATVNLMNVLQLLQAYGILKPNQVSGLYKPLENALRSLNKGAYADACKQLLDFINKVMAKTPTPIDRSIATYLISSAQAIRSSLGCP